LKEEADLAKKRLIEDLNSMTIKNVDIETVGVEEEDPRARKFTVSNPVKISGHIKYTVKGEDSEGPFEEVRRFREFYTLRNILIQRWPGVYIPAIPEKKLVVSINLEFLLTINVRVTKMISLLKREEVYLRGS
jgi:hypothetical protein